MDVATDRTADRATGILAVGLWLFLVVAAVFGLLLLFAPAYLAETVAGSEAFPYAWVRWSGGLLLGLAFGAWMVLQRPAGQEPFVTAMAAGSVLAGPGLLLGWALGEFFVPGWFQLVTLLATIGVGLVLWVGRAEARAG